MKYYICFIAATSRAFYLPSVIRRPLVNAFLVDYDITSFIVLLQQICSGLSRQSLVTTPLITKQEKANITGNHTEEQIIEMREFIGQILIDTVRSLKENPRVVQIVQELLEVILFINLI